MGEERELADGFGYDEVVLELSELHCQIEEKIWRRCRTIEDLIEKIIHVCLVRSKECKNDKDNQVLCDLNKFTKNVAAFSSIRRFASCFNADLTHESIKSLHLAMSRNKVDANKERGASSKDRDKQQQAVSSTWGRDSIRLTGGRLGFMEAKNVVDESRVGVHAQHLSVLAPVVGEPG